MKFVLWLKLKIADRYRIWRIYHFVIGEIQSQNHSCGLLRFLFLQSRIGKVFEGMDLFRMDFGM